jgi:hypothetical protein
VKEAIKLKRDALLEENIADCYASKGDGMGAMCHRTTAEWLEGQAERMADSQAVEPVSCGEVLPGEDEAHEKNKRWLIRDTLARPTVLANDASISRTDLLLQDNLDIAALAIDAANTIEASNSLEKMLAHQMALAHEMAMKTGDAAMHELQKIRPAPDWVDFQRKVNSIAKLMSVFQQGMLTLQKLRTGGNQTMTVQHVHVESGGQALIGTVQGGVPQGEDRKK